MEMARMTEDSSTQELEADADGRGLLVVGGGGLGSVLQQVVGSVELDLLGQQNWP